MPPVRAVAEAHYRQQVALARTVATEMTSVWSRFDRDMLDRSWLGAIRQLLALLVGGQTLAARSADTYVPAILEAQGIESRWAARMNARQLTGVASDGRDLEGLLRQPLITTKVAIAGGATVDRAMTAGLAQLDMIARTQIADAGRVADGLGIVLQPQVDGYVRMLNPPSCARCVILAGKWYRYNAGFERHERCDCKHIPAQENASGDLTTNPYRYLESVSRAEQERILGKAGARAVMDDGADINQVVNARRGMQTANVFGRRVLITSEGTTRRGLAGSRLGARDPGAVQGLTRQGTPRTVHRAKTLRLMPETLYADAGRLGWSREELIRQLHRFGYIL